MRLYNTSGTLGDTFVNCCKLCNIKERIIVNHYQKHKNFNKTIRKIYSLIPNIKELNIINTSKIDNNLDFSTIISLPGKFPLEPDEIKMNFFPSFKFKSKPQYKFPYIALQPKSGREEQKKEISLKTINKIIKTSKYEVVLIGTAKKFGNIKGCINLINKTSIFDAFCLIKNAKYFIGFFGIMAMVALSHRVNCNFIYNYKGEMKLRVYGTPWEKYCKKIVSYKEYIDSQNSLKYYAKFLNQYIFDKFYKIEQLRMLSNNTRFRLK